MKRFDLSLNARADFEEPSAKRSTLDASFSTTTTATFLAPLPKGRPGGLALRHNNNLAFTRLRQQAVDDVLASPHIESRTFLDPSPSTIGPTGRMATIDERLTQSVHGSLGRMPYSHFGGFSEFQSRYPEHCESSGKEDGSPPPPSLSQSMTSNSLKRPSTSTREAYNTIASPRYAQNSLSQPCISSASTGPTNILPYLYLGSQQDAQDVEMLKAKGIKYVVNMSMHGPRSEYIASNHFLRVEVNDSFQEKLRPHFDKAFDFIDRVRESDAAVLVHCLAGISRSPTLAIAYIMNTLHMTSSEAYNYVKTKRTTISPNFNFLGQLEEFEKELHADRRRLALIRLKKSMKRPIPPMASKALRATMGKTTGITTLATLIKAAKARGENVDALSDTDTPTVSKVQHKTDVHFREPSTKKSADDDFYFTDDDEPMYMRRSLSCPLKIHKSNSETRLSIRRPPEFENVEEESIATAAVVTDVKRGRSSTDETESCATIDAQQLQQQSLTITRSESTPMYLAQGSAPFALGRPSFLTRLRDRVLRIPQPVKEDLPSPSTDFNNRLSFTDPPNTAPQHAVNPFFNAASETPSMCGPSLCSASVIPNGLCGTSSIETISPANLPKPTSFAHAIVNQQPTTSSTPSSDPPNSPFVTNPTFRATRPVDVNPLTMRQSTTSTDSGVSAASTLAALFRHRERASGIPPPPTTDLSPAESGIAQEMEMELGSFSKPRDPERESMGSTSSLEIAVNS